MKRAAAKLRLADPVDLLEQAVAGRRRALGRLLTLIEQGGRIADEITELLHSRTQDGARGAHTAALRGAARSADSAAVIGVTGAPGCGKSTLVGRLVAELSKLPEEAGLPEESGLGRSPAVLAVDPSSPLTGGAILGDRIRMEDSGPVANSGRSGNAGNTAGNTDNTAGNTTGSRVAGSAGAFIRSMATRGHAGGLALAVPAALRLFEACGYGPLVVETVGVGQVEVDVTRTADTTVVVVAPGMGDAVQANKSGLLEVADVLVVNKSDRPGAEDAKRDLQHMLDLGHVTGLTEQWRPPVVMTAATVAAGDGADRVVGAVRAHREHLQQQGLLQARRQARIRQEIHDRVSQRLSAAAEHCLGAEPEALAEALEGRITPAAAAAAISRRLLVSEP
ncbi:MAG: methylmalonyl Co-A mutase-associated GTPase MeaB [Acidimicrobiaceae bacterium]|nr:methylmalonyl Co-A mutase-associated GTPase MeaB [Acidimicrobiaceae bacterium]MCY4281117.1 methylmalonyl Co-A mutase-associated GTPase MeaB [Acidimicrobiaceae bacterium]